MSPKILKSLTSPYTLSKLALQKLKKIPPTAALHPLFWKKNQEIDPTLSLTKIRTWD